MKPFTLICALALVFNGGLSAQTSLQNFTLNSGGTYATAPADSLALSYSIGDAVISPFSLGGNAGFQQAWLVQLAQTAATDSVWPGDANDDGIANNIDLLAIGLGFGTTGPARPGASLNWIAQSAAPWVQPLPTANYKHTDCDGNGLIEAADTLAIQQNYGQTHSQKWQRTNGVPLTLTWEDSIASIGDTLQGTIHFGLDTLTIDTAYGVAFSVEVDTALMDFASLELSFANNWIGTVGTNAISLTHRIPTENRADLALTRTDQQAVSGFGMVANLSIIMIDDLAGKQDTPIEVLRLTRPYAIDNRGNEIPVVVTSATVRVDKTLSAVSPIDPASEVRIFPNPATHHASLQTPAQWQGSYTVWDSQGRLLTRGALTPTAELDVTRWPNGIYMVEVQNGGQRTSLPLKVQH